MKAVSGLKDVGDNYTKKTGFMGTGVKGSGPFGAGLPREPDPPWLLTVAPPGLPAHSPCCLVLNPFYGIKCMMRHCFATCLESAILNGANFHISSGANY